MSAPNSKSYPSSKPSADKGISKGNKKASYSNTSSKKCFKCQGYGHIASEYPNRKVVTLVEEDVEKDEENPEEPVYDEDVVYVDEGKCL